jgi:hypothetical protein
MEDWGWGCYAGVISPPGYRHFDAQLTIFLQHNGRPVRYGSKRL